MKTKRYLLFLVCWFFIPLQPAFSATQRGMDVVPPATADLTAWGTYHALIIGINAYERWPRLQTAVKDASALRNVLVDLYGFPEENVHLLTDKEASRLNIIRHLRHIASGLTDQDNLLIYFAGHGQIDAFTSDGYWIPVDGFPKEPATWISHSLLKGILGSDKMRAKNVLVIADSCYSGTLLRGGPSTLSLEDGLYESRLAKAASLRSRQVITSGGLEPVSDGGRDGHSLFAYYLIEALRNNDCLVIDIENLIHTSVWEPVVRISGQRPTVGRLKTPMDEDGQFVLMHVALAEKRKSEALRAQESQLKQKEEEIQELEARKKQLNAEREKLVEEQKRIELERLQLELERQKLELAREREALEREKKEAAAVKYKENTKNESKKEMKEPESKTINMKLAKLPLNGSISSVKIALLPMHISNQTSGLGGILGSVNLSAKDTIQHLSSLFSNAEHNFVIFSYYPIKSNNSYDIIPFSLTKEEVNSIWYRKSIFSLLRLNLQEALRIGKELKVDIALSIYSEKRTINEIISEIIIIDINSGEIYSSGRRNTSLDWYGDFIAEQSRAQLERYLADISQ